MYKQYEILKKREIAPNTYSMDIYAPLVARRTMPGQFIILRVDERGERIPLTSADWDREQGWVQIVFQAVGASTKMLAGMEPGMCLKDFAGPLGKPSRLKEINRAVCIGGGVGTAVVYPSVKWLFETGRKVDVIIGARSEDFLIFEEDIRKRCNHLYITTDDGSKGRKGFVTDQLKELLDAGNEYDEVIAIGPMPMMKFVAALTKKYGLKTTVSLNPLMVDGTGMCGCCRVTVGDEIKYACVDGPEFDGHLVDYDEAINRQRVYMDEECEKTHQCRLEGALND